MMEYSAQRDDITYEITAFYLQQIALTYITNLDTMKLLNFQLTFNSLDDLTVTGDKEVSQAII